MKNEKRERDTSHMHVFFIVPVSWGRGISSPAVLETKMAPNHRNCIAMRPPAWWGQVSACSVSLFLATLELSRPLIV
jgi:hypothetical protein